MKTKTMKKTITMALVVLLVGISAVLGLITIKPKSASAVNTNGTLSIADSANGHLIVANVHDYFGCSSATDTTKHGMTTFYIVEGACSNVFDEPYATNAKKIASGVVMTTDLSLYSNGPSAPYAPSRYFVVGNIYSVGATCDSYYSNTLTFKFLSGNKAEVIYSLPADPVKEGYTFVGWYLDSALTIPYTGQAITGSMTFYAKFTINRHTVTFNTNGGTAASNQTVDWGTTISNPTTTREGYTFGGWYTDSNCTNAYSFSSQVKSNFTLYAKWTINRFTVSFMSSYTSVPSQTVDWNTTATAPEITREGYTFGGWYIDTGYTTLYNFSSPVKSNFTLYAKWTINRHTVTFNANGGSTVGSQTVDWGTTISNPTTTREGYTFGGWYTDSNCTNAYSFSSQVKSNFTLYAKWTINRYTVSFMSPYTSVPSQTVDWNTTITAPEITREGYTFGGWYIDTGYTTLYSFSSPVKNDFTLYAKWTINRHTVTFNANGGSAVSSQTVDWGTTISNPTTTKEGYTFGAWYTDSNLTNTYSFSAQVKSDFTLYAKWNINRFTVSFMSPYTSVPSQTVDWNTTITAPEITRENYIFCGWYADTEFTALYEFSSLVKNNFTLYAKWIAQFHKVTFVVDGEVYFETMIEHGTVINEIVKTESLPFRQVYTDSDMTILANEIAVVRDMDLYAVKYTSILDSIGDFFSNTSNQIMGGAGLIGLVLVVIIIIFARRKKG